MPVNVIGTLKPKNNGKFPVAEAVDIKVTGDMRLDEALENKADLETLNYALANKADKTTTTALQSQIDEIAQSQGAGTADTEIAQARVGADGTTYPNLKGRCDATDNKLANVDYVSKINSLNKKYEAIITGNLIDKSTLLEKSYLLEDGSVATAQAGYYVTDYIPLYGNNISAKTGGSNALVGAAVYNSDFEFIRAYKVQTLNYSYTSGDAYIRIMLREEDIANARAFYGTTLKNYVSFISDSQQNAKDINTLNSSVSLIEAQTEINKEDIANIESKFISYERVEFSAFDTPTTPTGSTNFKGFATPYEFHGKISSVEVNASYFMTGATEEADYTLTILDTDFSTVIATTTKTVSEHNGTESFTFENEVVLDGTYYFRVTTEAENAYFSVANAATEKSERSAQTPNYYLMGGTWTINTISYDIDLKLCITDYKFPDPPHNENVLYVGSSEDCDFADVQSAINSINDDDVNNPYIIYVYPGTYQPFTMVYTDNSRITPVGRVRYISIIGIGCRNDVVFSDNRGNYKFSPCEIYTNGVIKNMSFIDRTDSEHHTQETGRTFAYAVHSDFGTCKTRFENCYMYSNAGPAIGCGTWINEILEFQNCRFESDCDGTYGATGQGAFFCHTATDGTNRTNQQLRVHDCIAIATGQTYGARFAVIAGYEGGTYSYEFQNFGSFGQNGAAVSLQAPDDDLLSSYCFNNTPSTLNN